MSETHTLTGNCWLLGYACKHRGCRDSDSVCDVCHLHDEPRGECRECPRCPLCDAEIENDQT